MKTENKNDKKFQHSIPTLHSENNRFSLCPDSYFAQGQFQNSTVPGRNSYFARQSENSYFVRDNSRIFPIPTLHRTYTCIYVYFMGVDTGATGTAFDSPILSVGTACRTYGIGRCVMMPHQ